MFAAPLSQQSINCNCLEYRCVCMQCVRVLCRATSKRGRQTDAVIPTRICLNDEIIAFNFDVRLTNVLSLVLSQHKYTHRYCVVLLLCPQKERVIVTHLGNFSLFVFFFFSILHLKLHIVIIHVFLLYFISMRLLLSLQSPPSLLFLKSKWMDVDRSIVSQMADGQTAE